MLRVLWKIKKNSVFFYQLGHDDFSKNLIFKCSRNSATLSLRFQLVFVVKNFELCIKFLNTPSFSSSEFSGQARGTPASSLPRPITRNRGPLEAGRHHFRKIIGYFFERSPSGGLCVVIRKWNPRLFLRKNFVNFKKNAIYILNHFYPYSKNDSFCSESKWKLLR